MAINQKNHGRIFTVSQLTAAIKDLLEERFPFVWITGEVSNFRSPASGHYYFVLKDAGAQIQAVMFRGQNRILKFMVEDGMCVTGLGRINVYEMRGAYQIILEYLEPKGIGALQAAFEQLKIKLADEGLFDPVHKRPIPFLPRKIGIVTSPSGSVLYDMLQILGRRFSTIPVLIYPVKVQGDGSEHEIASALDHLNRRSDIDVIVLARGGGSLEDLQAFNSETVARAVFRSEIPVVSAVGHETDFTIADFAADLRAPTPSAAAELIVPRKEDLMRKQLELFLDLKSGIDRCLQQTRLRVEGLAARLRDPGKKVVDFRIKTDDYMQRGVRSVQHMVRAKRQHAEWRRKRLWSAAPQARIDHNKLKLKEITNKLLFNIQKIVSKKQSDFYRIRGKIEALDPHAVLDRGYSIAQRIPDGAIIYDSGMIDTGEKIYVTLSKGYLISRVERKN